MKQSDLYQVLGIALCCYNVLLLPLDVANQKGKAVLDSDAIPMDTVNLVFFAMTIVMAIAIVPFTMFYYEGVDESDDFSPYLLKACLSKLILLVISQNKCFMLSDGPLLVSLCFS